MMLKLASGTALLFGLIGVSFPLHASETGSVTINVCNAGKADIDALLLQGGIVSSSHVGAADCVSVAKSSGAMKPANIGFAFADSKGQWGATHRIDVLPDLGSLGNNVANVLALLGSKAPAPGPPILSAANQTTLVRHAGKDISLPLQLLLRPPLPICRSYEQPSRLPGATSYPVTGLNSKPDCTDSIYTLNVEAFPDTREITFKPECDPCDKKADAKLTPSERAAQQRLTEETNRLITTLVSGMERNGAHFEGLGGAEDQGRLHPLKEAKERAERLRPPEAIAWSDLTPALKLMPDNAPGVFADESFGATSKCLPVIIRAIT